MEASWAATAPGKPDALAATRQPVRAMSEKPRSFTGSWTMRSGLTGLVCHGSSAGSRSVSRFICRFPDTQAGIGECICWVVRLSGEYGYPGIQIPGYHPCLVALSDAGAWALNARAWQVSGSHGTHGHMQQSKRSELYIVVRAVYMCETYSIISSITICTPLVPRRDSTPTASYGQSKTPRPPVVSIVPEVS